MHAAHNSSPCAGSLQGDDEGEKAESDDCGELCNGRAMAMDEEAVPGNGADE